MSQKSSDGKAAAAETVNYDWEKSLFHDIHGTENGDSKQFCRPDGKRTNYNDELVNNNNNEVSMSRCFLVFSSLKVSASSLDNNAKSGGKGRIIRTDKDRIVGAMEHPAPS